MKIILWRFCERSKWNIKLGPTSEKGKKRWIQIRWPRTPQINNAWNWLLLLKCAQDVNWLIAYFSFNLFAAVSLIAHCALNAVYPICFAGKSNMLPQHRVRLADSYFALPLFSSIFYIFIKIQLTVNQTNVFHMHIWDRQWIGMELKENSPIRAWLQRPNQSILSDQHWINIFFIIKK